MEGQTIYRSHQSGIALCTLLVWVLAIFGWGGLWLSPLEAHAKMELRQMLLNIHWLGHDSFRIEGDGLVIYTDPWQLKGGPKADLILITHEHGDHSSPADIAKIQKEDTVIVTIAAAAAKLSGQIEVVKPGDKLTVKGLQIHAVPAYNVNKFRSPGVSYHPKDAGHVGFVITVEGLRIYHAGDTDHIPEMGSVEVDIALLPVSGIYVMTADEAAEAAATIKPQIAIPMHVAGGIGSMADAEHFRDKVSVPAEILPLED